MDNPFCFSGTMLFACSSPDSSFVFGPANDGNFHWYGDGLDKIGKYTISHQDPLTIDLVWNYGRELSYTVISFVGNGDMMTSFVLQDTRTGKLYSFMKSAEVTK